LTEYMLRRLKANFKGVHDDEQDRYRITVLPMTDEHAMEVFTDYPPDRKDPPPDWWQGDERGWKKHCVREGRLFRKDSAAILMLALAYDGEMHDGIYAEFHDPDLAREALDLVVRARTEQDEPDRERVARNG